MMNAQSGEMRRLKALKSARTLTIFLYASLGAMVLGTVLLGILPFIGSGGSPQGKIVAYGLAGLFWALLVFQIVSIVLCSAARRRLEAAGYRYKRLKPADIGVICFFKTPAGVIADCLTAATVVAFGLLFLLDGSHSQGFFPCTAMMFLFFQLHCLLNGKNYRYKLAYSNYEKEHTGNE